MCNNESFNSAKWVCKAVTIITSTLLSPPLETGEWGDNEEEEEEEAEEEEEMEEDKGRIALSQIERSTK